jgi:hypothetical protein
MEGAKAEDALLAVKVGWRDVSFIVMVSVIGLWHDSKVVHSLRFDETLDGADTLDRNSDR